MATWTIDVNNPIRNVDMVILPTPSVYKWGLQDISASDVGRTEDVLMKKKRIGQKVKIDLEWHNITGEAASDILKAFNPQYIQVTYLDAMQDDYLTKTFYVGDRSAPLYNSTLGLWSNVSFNIIEQ